MHGQLLGFGAFKTAASRNSARGMFEIFDVLMYEETRHIVFFINYMAWRGAAWTRHRAAAGADISLVLRPCAEPAAGHGSPREGRERRQGLRDHRSGASFFASGSVSASSWRIATARMPAAWSVVRPGPAATTAAAGHRGHGSSGTTHPGSDDGHICGGPYQVAEVHGDDVACTRSYARVGFLLVGRVRALARLSFEVLVPAAHAGQVLHLALARPTDVSRSIDMNSQIDGEERDSDPAFTNPKSRRRDQG